MRTTFTEAQLADPATADSEKILRACVHCGFCTATCPTYVLLGDELDSPRGRIYLIKDMLENERAPTPQVVKHIDRCLSCLACMTTCPSGVHYMHLIDHARAYVRKRFTRERADRMLRTLLAWVLPHRMRFRLALMLAPLAKPFAPALQRYAPLKPLAAMLRLAPKTTASSSTTSGKISTPAKGKVILLQGCVEPVLKPGVKAAAARLLARYGYEIASVRGEVCCGALVHHMGDEHAAEDAARRNIDAWIKVIGSQNIAAVLTTASGCGTAMKNYGYILRNDPAYAAKAARVSALARDISEFLAAQAPLQSTAKTMIVAYHAACSLQHGQQIKVAPKQLLEQAGFAVFEPAESHLCCGSAGTYNILQSDIAEQLGARKAERLKALKPRVVTTGNIGCMTQLENRLDVPVMHVVELLDWASGGPKPPALDDL